MSNLDRHIDLFYDEQNHISGPPGSDGHLSTVLRDALDGSDLNAGFIYKEIQAFSKNPAGRFQRDALSLAADWFINHYKLCAAQIDLRNVAPLEASNEENSEIWQEYLNKSGSVEQSDGSFGQKDADANLANRLLFALKYLVFCLETGDGDFEGNGALWKDEFENNKPIMPAVRAIRSFAQLLLDSLKKSGTAT